MSANMNPFAMLSMDDTSSDSDAQEETRVEQAPVVVPMPVKKAAAPLRTWSEKPVEVRDWNLQELGHRRRKGPFARYAFRDEERPKVGIPRQYAFQDESPPETAVQTQIASPSVPVTVAPHTTTPIVEDYPPYAPITPPNLPGAVPSPDEKLSSQDYPKLTDYERPTTPPFPPDDRFYPTMAQRIKMAMERKVPDESKVTDVKTHDKKTFHMNTVIPMPTRISDHPVLH